MVFSGTFSSSFLTGSGSGFFSGFAGGRRKIEGRSGCFFLEEVAGGESSEGILAGGAGEVRPGFPVFCASRIVGGLISCSSGLSEGEAFEGGLEACFSGGTVDGGRVAFGAGSCFSGPGGLSGISP